MAFSDEDKVLFKRLRERKKYKLHG